MRVIDKDRYGRKVNYLRLSITDRCNLRCLYCVGCFNYKFIPHDKILRYEECIELIDIAKNFLGISKVRFTGGEPFVRRGFVDFVKMVFDKFPGLDLRITTNGTLLEPYINELSKIGLKTINISLDTFDRDKFKFITGKDEHTKVMSSIFKCIEKGIKVKINVVALKSINDNEIEDFVKFAIDYPVDVRFIEFMPIGEGSKWQVDFFLSSKDILKKAFEVADLIPVEVKEEEKGPANMYWVKGGKGRIGLISPLTNHFCSTCNRIRITADGRLRTCLFSDKEYRLIPILRSNKLSKEKLLEVIKKAVLKKPLGVDILKKRMRLGSSVCAKIMSAIGG